MIASNNILNWQDIEAIYVNLRAAQTEFNATLSSIPSNSDNIAITEHLANLITDIEKMSVYTAIGNKANISATPPDRGDIITPGGFQEAATVAQTISEICNFAFNGSNFSGNFSFGDDGSDHSGNFSFGRDGSDFSGHFSFSRNSSDFSGNFSFDGSNISFNFGFNSSDFSGNFGFGCSRNVFNACGRSSFNETGC